MNILDKYLPFVKEQIDVQDKLATKFTDNQWRKDLHIKSRDTFKGLYQDIEETISYIEKSKSVLPLQWRLVQAKHCRI